MFLGLAILAGAELATAQRPLGMDVSHYQDAINWTNVADSGIAFAWCKATEETNYTDPSFTSNVFQAKSFILPIGLYHFAHPEVDMGTAGADAEAAYFWSIASNYITADGLSMMPVLDYETDPNTYSNYYTAASSSQWVNEWCQDIVNYGLSNGLYINPIVYTYSGFITTWFDTSATNWPLWYANDNGRNPLTSTPGSTRPWPTWQFWQYGEVDNPGVTNGEVDADVFNGTAVTLQNYTVGSVPPAITQQPADLTVTETGTATFSVSAIYDPVAYQWLIDGNPIDGATNATLTVTNVQMSDAGDYSVIVFNPYNFTYSADAVLTVQPLVSIYGVSVAPRLTSAIITWTTTTNATGQALYGTDANCSMVLPVNPALTVQHSMLLVGLQTNTTYYFELVSSNGPYIGTYTGSFSTSLSLIMESSQASYSGIWTVASAAPDKYSPYYEFADTVTGSDSATALFRPNIATPGLYDVYLWYSAGTNRSSAAPVTIGYNGGGTETFVNETTNGGSWQLVASALPFAAGTNGYVRLGNGSGESNKVVIADAVQFTFNTGQDLPANNTPPAWWLDYYFGTNAVSAAQDPDGDGYSTLAEYIVGTDPTDATSHLRVWGQAAPGGGVQVIFSPYYYGSGRQYQLQSRASLTNGVWTNLPFSPVITNANGEGVLTVTNLSGSQNFLRLSVSMTQ